MKQGALIAPLLVAALIGLMYSTHTVSNSDDPEIHQQDASVGDLDLHLAGSRVLQSAELVPVAVWEGMHNVVSRSNATYIVSHNRTVFGGLQLPAYVSSIDMLGSELSIATISVSINNPTDSSSVTFNGIVGVNIECDTQPPELMVHLGSVDSGDVYELGVADFNEDAGNWSFLFDSRQFVDGEYRVGATVDDLIAWYDQGVVFEVNPATIFFENENDQDLNSGVTQNVGNVSHVNIGSGVISTTPIAVSETGTSALEEPVDVSDSEGAIASTSALELNAIDLTLTERIQSEVRVVYSDDAIQEGGIQEQEDTQEDIVRLFEPVMDSFQDVKTEVAVIQEQVLHDSIGEESSQERLTKLPYIASPRRQAILEARVLEVDSGLFVDTDNDSLIDFDEKYVYLTDYTKADTDSDTVDDGDEVIQGRNPLIPDVGVIKNSSLIGDISLPQSTLGPDRRIHMVDERLFSDSIFYQDVRIVGSQKEDLLMVKKLTYEKRPNGSNDQVAQGESKLFIEGEGPPLSIVTVYLFSEPLVARIQADSSGVWEYVVTEDLADGNHELYVAVTGASGEVFVKSRPVLFSKNEGKLVIDETFGLGLEQEKSAWAVLREEYMYTMLLMGIIVIGWTHILFGRRKSSKQA